MEHNFYKVIVVMTITICLSQSCGIRKEITIKSTTNNSIVTTSNDTIPTLRRLLISFNKDLIRRNKNTYKLVIKKGKCVDIVKQIR